MVAKVVGGGKSVSEVDDAGERQIWRWQVDHRRRSWVTTRLTTGVDLGSGVNIEDVVKMAAVTSMGGGSGDGGL